MLTVDKSEEAKDFFFELFLQYSADQNKDF